MKILHGTENREIQLSKAHALMRAYANYCNSKPKPKHCASAEWRYCANKQYNPNRYESVSLRNLEKLVLVWGKLPMVHRKILAGEYRIKGKSSLKLILKEYGLRYRKEEHQTWVDNALLSLLNLAYQELGNNIFLSYHVP